MARRHGFTRIEALVFIAAIAIMALPIILGCGDARQIAAEPPDPPEPPPDPALLQREADLRAILQQLRDGIAAFLSDTGLYPAALADITNPPGFAPPVGLDGQGMVRMLNSADYKGPYVTTPNGGLPYNPITASTDWAYETVAPEVGNVSAPPGTASDGSDYSTW